MTKLISLAMLVFATTVLAESPNTDQNEFYPRPGRVFGVVRDLLIVDVTDALPNTPSVHQVDREDANGIPHSDEVTYRVRNHIMIPISHVRFTTPQGVELNGDGIAPNTPVVVCKSEALPALWRELLKENVCVVCARKQEAFMPSPSKPAPNTLSTESISSSRTQSTAAVFTNLGNAVGVPTEVIDAYGEQHGLSREAARRQLRMEAEKRLGK
ncbi:MAG: hypothetical protein KDB23_04815 [Planctomycetales bacterium]|nr:hypothetical protein [Planctomycetales bacterium]